MSGEWFYPTGKVRAEWIKDKLKSLDDITIQSMSAGDDEIAVYDIIFVNGMVDPRSVQDFLLPQLEKLSSWRARHECGQAESEYVSPFESKLIVPIDPRTEEEQKHMFAALFSGNVLILLDESLFLFDASDIPGREPEESTMEVSLVGPRDGFIEKLSVNVALMRKRLKTADLRCEYWTLGTETMTKVAVLHLEGTARPALVQETRSRKALQNSFELAELISDRKKSLFPLIDATGRPDYAVQSLLNGRIVIVVDGCPSVLLAPTNLFMLIKSPEDAHLPFYYVSLERILRAFGFVISLCLPGFWVSLSAYNIDQLPYTLLSTIALSRQGLPMSASVEMILMLFMFELFREAGVRLPRAVGQTVTVVGGLIVGDAAIRAGMTSPTMLVVAAVTAVASFTLISQSLTGSVTLLRLTVLLVSSLLGLFGFFIASFAILIYLCSLKSFGYPYLSPLAPLNAKDLIPGLLQHSWSKRIRRRKPL